MFYNQYWTFIRKYNWFRVVLIPKILFNKTLKMDELEKLSKGLSGVAGEYLVACELSRRGYMASVTLRNSDSIDIHASKMGEDKFFAIQVKTKQYAGRAWPLNKKTESLKSPNLFYIFVSLKGLLERPDYFIVPSEIIATTIKDGHANWLKTLSKSGKPHNDTNIRLFYDKEGNYLERWDLLH